MRTRISSRCGVFTAAILAISMLQFGIAKVGFASEDPEAETPGQAYLAYSEALSKGDFKAVHHYLASAKVYELIGETDAAAIATLQVLDPLEGLAVVDESVDGDRATVTARGEAMGIAATGTIQMILEDGGWKLLGELWELGGDSNTRAAVEAPVSLHDAARAGDTAAVAAGIESGVDVNARDHVERTPLSWAANFGHTETMKLLISSGADVDLATDDGETPLMVAAAAGEPDALVLLVNAGANVNATDESGRTALMNSAQMSDWVLGQMTNGEADAVRMIRALTEAGAEVNYADPWQNRTALMVAAETGRTEVVRALLEAGAEVNPSSGAESGTTAVIEAAKSGNAETVGVLIAAGADLGATDRTGRTILDWAADSPEIIEVLKEQGVEGADAVTSSLEESRCASDDPQRARDRLAAKGYGEISGDQLLSAAAQGDRQSVLLFLEAGVPVNFKDRNDHASTALNRAVSHPDDPDTALILISCGADPNAGSNPPLINAAQKCGFTEVVQALIDAGADVNGATPTGFTALQFATLMNCEGNARILREAGAVEK